MRKVLISLGALLVPGLAAADPLRGAYVSAEGGANFIGALQSSNGSTRIDSDAGPVGVAAVGARLGGGFRVEVEGSYRSNDISRIATLRLNGARVPLADVQGRVGAAAALANLLYDAPYHPHGLRPYVGIGGGYGDVRLGSASGAGVGVFHLADNNTFTGPDLVRFGRAGAFAYQAIAGASLPLRGARGFELTGEYRFFGAGRAGVPVTRVGAAGEVINGAIPSSATQNGFVLHDSAVLVGFRYSFGGRQRLAEAPTSRE